MYNFSDEAKERILSGKVTRCYLKVLETDTKPELIINESNYLKDCTFEELRYVPDKGIIGGAVAKRVTGNFNNIEEDFNIQDREFELYFGVDLEDGTTEYQKFGTFIVQKPKDDQVTDNTSFEALDYMVKANLDYEDRITYPCTLKDIFLDVVDQCGLTTDITSFTNDDFIVEENPFVGKVSRRIVLQGIAMSAFNWVRIDENDKVVMDFEIKNTIDESLDTEKYFSLLTNDTFGPINAIILGDSQIKGEYVEISDSESIATYGKKEIIINDNPFAYTQSKRNQLIKNANVLYGMSYIPVTIDAIGYLFLNCKDRIEIEGLNGKKFYTYIFNHTIEYTGVITDTIESPASTENEVKYENTATLTNSLKSAERRINKAEGLIEDLIEEDTYFSSKISKHEQDINSITNRIEQIYNFERTVTGKNEILLEDALPTNILKFVAAANTVRGIYPSTTLFPSPTLFPRKGGTTITIVIGRTSRKVSPEPILPGKNLYPSKNLYPRSNGYYKREYSFHITKPLRNYENIHDKFIIELDEERGICIAKVLRYIEYDYETGAVIITNDPQEEIIGETELELYKGNNYVYIKEFIDWDITATYIFNNELNEKYATRIESISKMALLEKEIRLEVAEKTNRETLVASINLIPGQIKMEGLITANGGFEIDEKGNASISNGTVKINEKGIQLAEGTSIINANGLFSNLQFISSGLLGEDFGGQYSPLGVMANFTSQRI